MQLFSSSKVPLLAIVFALVARPSHAAQTNASAADAKAAVTQAQARYATARQRRDDVSRRLQAAQNKVNAVRSKGPNIGTIDASLQRLREQLLAMQSQAQNEIAELQSGMYCSGCNRTCSDLYAHGEPCPHSGQSLMPAPPEAIAAKVSEWKTKMASVQQQIEQLSAQRSQAIRDYESEVAEARAPVNELSSELSAANSEINSARAEVTKAANYSRLMEQREAMLAAERRRLEAEKLRQQLEAAREERRSAELAAGPLPSWTFSSGSTATNSPPSFPPTQPQVPRNNDADAPKAPQERLRTAEARERELSNQVAEQSSNTTTQPADASGIADDYKTMARVEDSQRLREASESSAESLLVKNGNAPNLPSELPSALSRPLKAIGTALQNGVAGAQLREEILTAAKAQLSEYTKLYRPDLDGLLPDELGDAAKSHIPEEMVRSTAKASLSDAANTILQGTENRPYAVRYVTDSLIDKTSDWFTHEVTDRIVSAYNRNTLGIEDKSTSTDTFERIEDAFQKAVSQGNLLLKTGGHSIVGLRKYFEDVNKRFFEFLDFAPTAIENAMQEEKK
jgi:hypothetical protein